MEGGLRGLPWRPLLLVALVAVSTYASWSQLGGRGVPASVPAPAVETGAAVGFTSARRLEEHYRKHGGEFGGVTQQQYLALARKLRDAPAGGPVLEAVRRDGVTTRFDRDSGAFVAFNRDRTIRTFFRPNDGERYFRRQAARDNEGDGE
jgi:pyocin large subunit-like protein